MTAVTVQQVGAFQPAGQAWPMPVALRRPAVAVVTPRVVLNLISA